MTKLELTRRQAFAALGATLSTGVIRPVEAPDGSPAWGFARGKPAGARLRICRSTFKRIVHAGSYAMRHQLSRRSRRNFRQESAAMGMVRIGSPDIAYGRELSMPLMVDTVLVSLGPAGFLWPPVPVQPYRKSALREPRRALRCHSAPAHCRASRAGSP